MNDNEANKMLLQQVDRLIEKRDHFAYKCGEWKKFWEWLKREAPFADTTYGIDLEHWLKIKYEEFEECQK